MKILTKKAVLYLRVSTEEQVDNFSLSTQEEICQREAKYKGYTVDKIFREEGRSAKSIKGREALIEMLDYCRKNRKEISAVIVYKTDRLSRQIFDYLVIQRKLNDLGISLISATEPTDNSAMGKFLGNFFAQIAQFDNDMRSERSRNGMHARFKSGLFHNSKPPVGYISLDKVVVKDPKTFNKIKEAWDLMATGTKSIREITRLLNSWGIPLRSSSVGRLFNSKFYMGILYSPTYQEEVLGQHVPMITRELFNKVRQVIEGRTANKPNLSRRFRLTNDFPMRRHTLCGKCGNAFTGAWSRGSKGIRYAYYFCRFNKICGSNYIPVKIAHDYLNKILKQIRINKYGEKLFLMLFEEKFKARYTLLDQKRKNYSQQLKKNLELQQTLIQKNLLGLYPDEIFKEQNDLLEQNIKSIRTLSDAQLIKKYSATLAREYILKQVTSLAAIYDSLDIVLKKQMLSFLFPEGLVWNYPGLSFSKLNPLFTIKPVKITTIKRKSYGK